ncbi:MAG: hypothetical protein MI864_09570 [Pseudomonadales bacterium]|nr:hypothetical protein [Pseudomonadales bacterium]
MENYRVIGTFQAQVIKSASGGSTVVLQSNTATADHQDNQTHKPRDITSIYAQYQPVNIFSTYSENRGMLWGAITLLGGDIWPDWDGQRIIIEASAARVIFYKYGGNQGRKMYIQSPRHFITDVTTNTFNRKAYEKTRLTARIAEWEAHFLVGFLGAAHWVGFVSVLAGDVLFQVYGEKKRNAAYKQASSDIVEVDNDLKLIAPVFRRKLFEVLIAGAKSNPNEKLKTLVTSLPELIIKDDKTTGRIAGAIAAKFIVNPKNNNLALLFILQTIVVQTATKSISKIPPAVGRVIQDTYQKLLPDMSALDPANPNDRLIIARHLIEKMGELGVSVTPYEAQQIVIEIRNNPTRIVNNMNKLRTAFETIINAGREE